MFDASQVVCVEPLREYAGLDEQKRHSIRIHFSSGLQVDLPTVIYEPDQSSDPVGAAKMKRSELIELIWPREQRLKS